MKATTSERTQYATRPALSYPNAATRRQVFQKVLDFLIMAASGVGLGALLLFILANA